MAEIQINEMPFAFAGVANPVNKSEDFVIKESNDLFDRLLGFKTQGFTFSELLKRVIGDEKPLLLKEITQNINKGNSEFICSCGSGIRYAVKLRNLSGHSTVSVFEIPESRESSLPQLAIHALPNGVILMSCDTGRVVCMNPAAQRLTGWGEDAVGMPVAGFLSMLYEDGMRPFDPLAEEKSIKRDEAGYACAALRNKDGGLLSVSVKISRFAAADGEDMGLILVNDNGIQKNFEQEILYLSYHDKLTGLYNRAYFEKKVKEFDHERYYPISIIMGDANGLKMTNDIFGHAQGDAVLIAIANILSLACRETDIIARYGGDEFVVLMPNTSLEESGRISKNILRLCDSQTGEKNSVSISLGYGCKERVTENINDTLNVAENFMYRHKLLESRSYRSSVISSLKKMLFEKSFETEEHAMRLTGLCAEAGQILGLSQSQLNDLELFSMLHDIGKIGVKDQVLLKPGKLTDEEWVEMRKHCEVGYRIAQSAPELAHIAEYILCHHEHYDGKGYPQGLKGDQIPLLARILAVADSFDAMVNDRYYRKALSKEIAISELKKCAGTQFDPKVVDVFLKILEPQPPKLSVVPPNRKRA